MAKKKSVRRTSSGRAITSSGRSRFPERVSQTALRNAARSTSPSKLFGDKKISGERWHANYNTSRGGRRAATTSNERKVSSKMFKDRNTGVTFQVRTSTPVKQRKSSRRPYGPVDRVVRTTAKGFLR